MAMVQYMSSGIAVEYIVVDRGRGPMCCLKDMYCSSVTI